MDSVQNKLVVFDLDGTLNRTDLYSVPAHRTAFEELGMFGIRMRKSSPILEPAIRSI